MPIWELFQDLSGSRPVVSIIHAIEGGIQTRVVEMKIPQSEIESGIRNAGITDRHIHATWAWIITRLDDVWLESVESEEEGDE